MLILKQDKVAVAVHSFCHEHCEDCTPLVRHLSIYLLIAAWSSTVTMQEEMADEADQDAANKTDEAGPSSRSETGQETAAGQQEDEASTSQVWRVAP